MITMKYLVLVIACLILKANSYFITVDETKFHLVKSYLCRYGYMNDNVCKQHADDSLKFMQNNARDIYRGLVIFQTMFNITRSGKIDEDTILKMAKPRCGNKDFDMQFSSSKFLSFRTNDFSLLRKSLAKLTYSIRKYNQYLNRYSKSVSNDLIESIVEKAFQAWLKHLHGDVRVSKQNEYEAINSNITIYFAEGNHGDSMLFDGIDGELAHSCSLSNTQSPFRGHIHLDDSENWNKGNRLMTVLMHQIGHLFGLDHSSNPKSVMSPLFYFGNEELLEEDVRNLRMILGLETKYKQTNAIATSPPTTTTHEAITTSTTSTTTTSTITTSTTTTSTTTTTTITTTTTTSTTSTTTTSTTTTSTTTTTTTSTTSTTPTTTTTGTSNTTYSSKSPKDEFGQVLSLLSEIDGPNDSSSSSLEQNNNSQGDGDDYVTSTLSNVGSTASHKTAEKTRLSVGTDWVYEVTSTAASSKFDEASSDLDAKFIDDLAKETLVTSSTEESALSEEVDLISPNSTEVTSDDAEYYELLKLIGATTSTTEQPDSIFANNPTKYTRPSSKHHEIFDSDYMIEESQEETTQSFIPTTTHAETTTTTTPNKYYDFTDEIIFPLPNKSNFSIGHSNTHSSGIQSSRLGSSVTTKISTTNLPITSSYESQYEDISSESLLHVFNDNNDEYLITLTTQKTTVEVPTVSASTTTRNSKTSTTFTTLPTTVTSSTVTTTTTTTTTITTTTTQSTTTIAKTTTKTATVFASTNQPKIGEANAEKEIDLCNDPDIDDITRTEWGNAFIFKGDYVWHVRGLTKWRLFDYEGWPRRISTLFPLLPSNIDSAYLYDDHYHFTKNQTLWKYKIILSYPPKYVLVVGYPRNLKEEYPDIPFKSVDSAFSIASSIFFFKDYEFWQSDWNTNLTGKIPFKTNAAVSWRNPRLDSSMTEPLAYIVSNSSMYKFNFWSIPISQETLDIRYFLFDCVQANYKPHNPLFLGPSYKQAFIADDVYNKNFKSRLVIRQAPGEYQQTATAAIATSSNKNSSLSFVSNKDESGNGRNSNSNNVMVKSLYKANEANALKNKLLIEFLVALIFLMIFI